MGQPAYLQFADNAQHVFNAVRAKYEKKVRSGSLEPVLEAHLAKYPGMIASLALITHLIDGGTGPVSLAATEKAIRWSVYLGKHAKRVYGAASSSAAASAKALAEKIEAGTVKAEFTARSVQRNGWRDLRTRDDVANALSVLEEHGWIKPIENTSPGRPSERYVVNPKVNGKQQA